MRFCAKACMVLVGLAAYFVFKTLALLEFTKENVFSGPTNCFHLPSPGAPEDIVFIPNTRIALAGVDDRVSVWLSPTAGPGKTPKGGIIAIYLPEDSASSPTTSIVPLTNFPSEVTFHPHGIDIFQDLLYVVNHAFLQGGERVDVFKIEVTGTVVSLTYQRAIILPDYMNGIANDISVVGPEEFYVSLWRTKPDPPEGRADTFIDTLSATISLITGKKHAGVYRCLQTQSLSCEKVISGLMSNGIAKRGNELFVADSVGKSISKYKVTPNGFQHVKDFKSDYSLDNVEYDPETDRLYAGSISRAMDFMLFTENAKAGKNIENEVIAGGCLEFNPDTGASRVLVNQQRLSGASCCARKGQFIAIGSWHDSHLLVCPLEESTSR